MVLKNRKADHVSPAGVCPAEVIVLKFGSSVLRTVQDLPNAVHEIYRWVRDGYRVIAVVSAIGNTTEVLIRDSQMLCAVPEAFATAELLATGERASAALLGIALDRAGVPAHVVSPREIGFEVTGTPLDAEPTGLDVAQGWRAATRSACAGCAGIFWYGQGRPYALSRPRRVGSHGCVPRGLALRPMPAHQRCRRGIRVRSGRPGRTSATVRAIEL